MNIKVTGDWAIALKLLTMASKDGKAKIAKAVDQESHYLVGRIKVRLREGPFKPLSATALRMRALSGFRGTKPLIRTGDMRNSVTRVRSGDTVFIGVPRTAKSKDGTSYVNIAQIHEEGRTFAMRITPAMRRFWFGVLFKGEPPQAAGSTPKSGGNIVIIQIPARPFIKPVFDAEAPGVPARLQERLAKLLGFT